MKRHIVNFDTVVAKAIGRLPKRWYGFFSLVGLVIRPSLWIALSLIFAGIFLNQNLKTFAFVGMLSALLVPISTVIKLFFRRVRPITIYTDAMKIKSYSFPSSHSYSAALVATFLGICAVYFFGAWSGVIIAVLALVVVTVAVSRVFVGAHYPSDVIGGVLLGVLVQSILFFLYLF